MSYSFSFFLWLYKHVGGLSTGALCRCSFAFTFLSMNKLREKKIVFVIFRGSKDLETPPPALVIKKRRSFFDISSLPANTRHSYLFVILVLVILITFTLQPLLVCWAFAWFSQLWQQSGQILLHSLTVTIRVVQYYSLVKALNMNFGKHKCREKYHKIINETFFLKFLLNFFCYLKKKYMY